MIKVKILYNQSGHVVLAKLVANANIIVFTDAAISLEAEVGLKVAVLVLHLQQVDRIVSVRGVWLQPRHKNLDHDS